MAKIDKRKTIKGKILSTKSNRLIERLQKEYKEADKEVKKSAKHDKRSYLDQQAEEAETTAAKGEMGKYTKSPKVCVETTTQPFLM